LVIQSLPRKVPHHPTKIHRAGKTPTMQMDCRWSIPRRHAALPKVPVPMLLCNAIITQNSPDSNDDSMMSQSGDALNPNSFQR
jgi:hypothetical protein